MDLICSTLFTPTGRRKSEKRYPVTVKDISCVKVVSLHVRCYGEHTDHNLLIEPYGSKVSAKSTHEINLELCASGLCERFAKPSVVCKYVSEVQILPTPLKI